jgi:spoIIIJ-associated protein
MGVEREFEGRDLKEALESASLALGIPREAFEFRLVDEGRRGLFGLGAKQVRIVVEAPEDGVPGDVEKPRDAEPDGEADEAALGSVEETLRRMLHLMGFDLEVRTEAADNAVRVFLAGPDRRALLQKDGELVSALQFLLNRMARRAWPEVGHVLVECEGFRDRREEDLVELVREVARQVARTGRPKKLHSMNPYERRLVHLTVREFPELTSHSAGDGFLKQITVAPVGHGGEA